MNLRLFHIEGNQIPLVPANRKCLTMSCLISAQTTCERRHEVHPDYKKDLSLRIYKERTGHISLEKSHSVTIVSISNIFLHLADLHMKIITQKQRTEKQLESRAMEECSKKEPIPLHVPYFQVIALVKKNPTQEIPICNSATKLCNKRK